MPTTTPTPEPTPLPTPTLTPISPQERIERDALAALYEATDGPNWLNNTNWLSDEPLDEWYGVTTNAYGHVTSLSLDGNGLTGEIPPELGNIANLESLNLHNNQLTQAIPPELGNLSNLEHLLLSQNQLSGKIPPELGNLSNLQWLNLNINQLTGSIPLELSNLPFLQVLRLGRNQLNGCIPEILQDAESNDIHSINLNFCRNEPFEVLLDRKALVTLYVATDWPNWEQNINWLSHKPIGEWFGVTTNSDGRVTALFLDGNRLSGKIPRALGTLSHLTRLSLVENHLTGYIPPELGNLSSLQQLLLHNNSLAQQIPSTIGNLSSLETLDLNGNQLIGQIPWELSHLLNLRALYLGGNSFHGCVHPRLLTVHLNDVTWDGISPCEVPQPWQFAAEREALIALYNAAGGPIWKNNENWLSDLPVSDWFGVTTEGNGLITRLSLAGNQLSGRIPPELGNLSNPYGLWLRAYPNNPAALRAIRAQLK